MSKSNLVLIGFMAAGKTTVGRALAERLGYTFADTDDMIVERAGKPVPRIFAEDGEAGFRAIERGVVADLAARGGVVVASGGGVIKDPRNIAALRASGTIVHLRLTPETAAERLLADGAGRPNIDDFIPERTFEHVLARARQLLGEREAAYQAAADAVVDVDQRSVGEIVAAVLAAVAESVP